MSEFFAIASARFIASFARKLGPLRIVSFGIGPGDWAKMLENQSELGTSIWAEWRAKPKASPRSRRASASDGSRQSFHHAIVLHFQLRPQGSPEMAVAPGVVSEITGAASGHTPYR